MTIDELKALGADTADGLARCLNNEAFYIRMVGMGLQDAHFEKLENAIREGRLGDAFESAHALKGILSNLALTPVLAPVVEITELLRAKSDADYETYVKAIEEEREKFLAVM